MIDIVPASGEPMKKAIQETQKAVFDVVSEIAPPDNRQAITEAAKAAAHMLAVGTLYPEGFPPIARPKPNLHPDVNYPPKPIEPGLGILECIGFGCMAALVKLFLDFIDVISNLLKLMV